MFPGMNPRAMQQAMRKMGVKQEEIEATEVIIKTPDKELVIIEPNVVKVNMMGQESLQITGEIHERELNSNEGSSEPEISEEDVETVTAQTGVDADKARESLVAAGGDLAKAILDIKGEE